MFIRGESIFIDVRSTPQALPSTLVGDSRSTLYSWSPTSPTKKKTCWPKDLAVILIVKSLVPTIHYDERVKRPINVYYFK